MSANESWNRFARRRAALWMLYGVLPLTVALVALLDVQPSWNAIKVALAAVYLAFVVTLQLRLSFWPCPHCGSPFFGGWRMPYAVRFFDVADRVCAHCGLHWVETSEHRSVTA